MPPRWVWGHGVTQVSKRALASASYLFPDACQCLYNSLICTGICRVCMVCRSCKMYKLNHALAYLCSTSQDRPARSELESSSRLPAIQQGCGLAVLRPHSTRNATTFRYGSLGAFSLLRLARAFRLAEEVSSAQTQRAQLRRDFRLTACTPHLRHRVRHPLLPPLPPGRRHSQSALVPGVIFTRRSTG